MKYIPKKIEIKLQKDEKLKAIVNLVFEDFLIKGFRIRTSDYENSNGDKLWVTPPSYKSGNEYRPMFYMPVKEKWEELEKIICKEYNKQVNT
jgi:DNA-binding cell septation regulator SpoVG